MRRVQNHFPFLALKISSENSYLNLCVANVAKYLFLFPLSKRAESLSISVDPWKEIISSSRLLFMQ